MLEANGQPLPLRVAHRRPDVVGVSAHVIRRDATGAAAAC